MSSKISRSFGLPGLDDCGVCKGSEAEELDDLDWESWSSDAEAKTSQLGGGTHRLRSDRLDGIGGEISDDSPSLSNADGSQAPGLAKKGSDAKGCSEAGLP